MGAEQTRSGWNSSGPARRDAPGSLDRFWECMRAKLAGPLPGRPAQALMAPLPRPGWHPDDRPAQPARESGVLVLLYPHRGGLQLPLIVRPRYDGAHSGQVAFAGGGREDGDANLTETALREAKEELGIVPGDVKVMGRLTELYIRPSNYEVTPTVGRLAGRPLFRPNRQEVAELMEVSIEDFLNPSNSRRERWQLEDRTALVPFYAIRGQTIWGATAMILSELLAVVRMCLGEGAGFGARRE